METNWRKWKLHRRTILKQFCVTLCIIMAMVFCLPISTKSVHAAENYEVYTDNEQGIEYELYPDGTCCVKKGSDACIEVVIPQEIEKEGKVYTVTSIREIAFEDCSKLKSVSIPEGVTEIGEFAFCRCSSLESVTIPKTVTKTNSGIFRDCSSLKSVNIPEGVTNIGFGMFLRCSSLENVIIPETVTSISNSAFYGCSNLKNVNIPEGVTEIRADAFSGCSSLEANIVIPESVEELWYGAFNGCTRLSGLSVAEGNKTYSSDEYGNIYNKNKTELKMGSPFMKNVDIAEGVKIIGEHAFYQNTNLKSVRIPEGVKKIDWYVFYGCSSLENITMPESLTEIGNDAFSYCISIESIAIPESVTELGFDVFSWCENLRKVNIPKNIDYIRGGMFEYCKNLSSVVIPENVRGIGERAFYCSGLESVTLPDRMSEIKEDAFAGCHALKSVTIPKSVTHIGLDAFAQSENAVLHVEKGSYAEKIALSRGYTYDYGEGTIVSVGKQKCKVKITSSSKNPTVVYMQPINTKATSVTIPHTISIGGISYKVTAIGNDALKENKKLTKVTIGKNIATIGKNAFKNCSALKNIVVKTDKLKTVGSNALTGTNKKLVIQVSSKKLSVYKKYFKGKGNTKITVKDI